MTYDFNNIPESELIPTNTVAKARLLLKSDNSSGNPWVKVSMNGNQYLDCEFIILGGPYDKRKVFHKIGLSGNETWINLSKRFVKNLLESANGLSRFDRSSEAEAFRKLNDWSDLHGLEVIIRIGIESRPNYPDRNKVLAVLTAENPAYKMIKAQNDPFYNL